MSNSVLYIHDPFLNPGDCFSYAGARHCIEQAIPVAFEQSVHLGTTRDIPSRLDLSGPDLLVFAGAPWFWEGCTRSPKYAAAYAHLQMMSGVRKMAVGVGSCFLAAHDKGALESIIQSEGRDLKRFWDIFDVIIVRDILAWWILSLVGVDSILAPCPSIEVGDWFGKCPGEGGTVVLSEPLEKNFMYSYLSEGNESFYRATLNRLANEGAARMEWIPQDRSILAPRSMKSMCREIAATKASRFFTARVHAALVATGMGLQGDLLALDSRALSASLCGTALVGDHAETFYALSADLEPSAPPVVDIRDAIHCGLEALP